MKLTTDPFFFLLNSESRVLIVESLVDGVFCAGADLKERVNMTPTQVSEFLYNLRQAFRDLEVSFYYTCIRKMKTDYIHTHTLLLLIFFFNVFCIDITYSYYCSHRWDSGGRWYGNGSGM